MPATDDGRALNLASASAVNPKVDHSRDADLLLAEVDALETTRETALHWAEALHREVNLDGNGPAQEAMENLLTALTERNTDG